MRNNFQQELYRVRLLARVRRWTHEACSSHCVHLFLTLLGATCSFLILITNGHQHEDGASTLDTNDAFIRTIHTGDMLKKSSLVSFALIIPLFIEGVINLVDRFFRGYDSTASTKDIHTTGESVIFQIGMMLPLIMTFMPFDTLHYGTAAYCLVRAHYAIVTGIFFASMVRHDPNFATPRLTILFYLLTVVSHAMAPYQFKYSTTYRTSETGVVGFIASIAADLALAILAVAWFRWVVLTLYRQGRYLMQWDTTETPETSRAKGELRFYIMYMFLAAFWITFKIVLILKESSSSVSTFKDFDWFAFNFPSILFQMFFLLLSMRCVRFEAVSSLYALIEAKKQYIRYIR